MKKVVKSTLILLGIVLIIVPIYYFFSKNSSQQKAYQTVQPTYEDIQLYTICSGIISPLEEVELKSRVPGVLDEILVQVGDSVKKGEVIGVVKLIPDMGDVEVLKSKINIARNEVNAQKLKFNRHKVLFDKGVIAAAEYEIVEKEYLNNKEELDNLQNQLIILESGSVPNSKRSNTEIRSTIDGIVTDIPVEVGVTITESNNFNDGTTITKIANLQSMIFEGKVMEYDVSKLRLGMPVLINTALDDENQISYLTEISTSGHKEDGVITFEIRSLLENPRFKKTGYSANAKILLKEKKDVLALKEQWITTKNDTNFVNIKNPDGTIEKRVVTTGFSDGIYTEVLSGVKDGEILVFYD